MSVTFVDELPKINGGGRGPRGLTDEVLEALQANPGQWAIIEGYKGSTVPPSFKRLEGYKFVTRPLPEGEGRAIYGAYFGDGDELL